MEVRFWGTRGSIPASLTAEAVWEKVRHALEIARDKKIDPSTDIDTFMEEELPFWAKATYGTNTPCLEIRDGERFLLCDAGTGLRDFGNEYMRTYGSDSPGDFHIFLTHFHWDHIQGFPFFVPAYIKGSRITFYGCHEQLKKVLTLQQDPPFFPVRLKDLPAEVRFTSLDPGERYEIEGFEVSAKEQNHPGLSYGYRFETDGRSIVYSTDAEYRFETDEEALPFIRFFDRADLLIFDAQYPFVDAVTIKEHWGHSNSFQGVELAMKARVKHLCLFHNDPATSDKDLDKLLMETERLVPLVTEGGRLKVSITWDGRVICV
jgi:phosphoribosyl 1,2-cyclic phosphodiesterase